MVISFMYTYLLSSIKFHTIPPVHICKQTLNNPSAHAPVQASTSTLYMCLHAHYVHVSLKGNVAVACFLIAYNHSH